MSTNSSTISKIDSIYFVVEYRILSIESTSHFLLHCPIFYDKRHTLLSTSYDIDSKILESNDSYLTQTLFTLGSNSFD